MSTSVIESGSYELFIDTGFLLNAFVLDDAVKGILSGYVSYDTRTNLVANPNFETGVTGWNGSNANYTVAAYTLDSYIGTASLSLTLLAATGTNNGAEFANNATYRIPCVQGQTFTASAYVQNLVGSRNWRIMFLGYSSATGAAATETYSTGTAVTNPTTWTRASSTYTITGATTLFLEVRIANSNTGVANDRVLIDAVLCETGSSVLPYFDGTYAEPYTGYTLTEQAWNGTAGASSSTATWGFGTETLSGYYLDGDTEFAPMLEYSTNVNVKRGRRDVGDQFSAGTMSFNLNDSLAGGTLNPLYSSSPYVDPTGLFTLAPLRRVSFGRYNSVGTFISLFVGQIVSYDYNYVLGGQNTVTVYCADDFYLLAQTALAEFNVSEQISSARLSAVLDLPEVAYPAVTRDIETSTQTLGGSAAYTVAESTNVKAYIDQIQQAEQGRIFLSRTGYLTSQPRIGNTLSGSVADFHDDGTNIPYNSLGILYNADLIVNRASIQHLGAASPQVADDLVSQVKYLIQNTSITNSLLHNDAAALTLANYLLVGEPEATFNAVQTDYLMLTTPQRETLSLVDIGDTITITNTISGGEVAQELAVEGIEIQVNVNNGHRVTFYTSPTVIVFEFILNDVVYGLLDIQDPQPVLG